MATTASRLYINGFEVGAFTQRSPTNGNLTIQSTTVRSGSYAARLQAASGTSTTFQMDLGAATYSQVIVRFYLYINALPSATRTLATTGTIFSTSHNSIGLTSAGKLCLMNGSTAQLTGSTTLTTGTWHRVEWRLNANQQTHQARLDGADELAATTCQFFTIGNASVSTIYLGCADSTASTMDLSFDDIAIDESDWVGDSKIALLTPASVYATTGGAFSVVGAASTAAALADWLNDATYAVSGTSSGTETYTLSALPGDLVSPRGVVLHCREKTGSGSMIYSFGMTDGLATQTLSSAFTDTSFTWKDSFYYSGATYGSASNGGITQTFLYGNWNLDRIQNLKLKLSSSSTATGNFSALVAQVEYVTSGSDPVQRVFLEGFEHTDLGDFTTTGTAAISSVQAHGGSSSLRINPSGSTASYINSSSTLGGGDVYIRAYVYVNAYPTSGNTCRLFDTVSFGSMNAGVRMDSGGHLRLEDASGLLGTGYSSTAIALGTWARVELHVHQSSSSSLSNGVGEIRLDGVSLQTASIKTFGTGTSAFTLRLGTDLAPGTGGVDFFLDDIAIDANTWPGAGYIAELLPNGSGSGDATSWTVTGAATHWQALAESVPDGATSYVTTSTTNGSYETYTLDDLPSGASSIAGTMIAFTEKLATGNTTLSCLCCSSATGIIPTVFSTTLGNTSAYGTIRHRQPWSPTSGNWTTTSLNAAYLKAMLGSTTALSISSIRVLADYAGAATNTKDVSASALISTTNTKDLTADAYLVAVNTSGLSVDATIQGTFIQEVAASGLLQQTDTSEATASGVITATSVLSATTDAVIQATKTLDVSASAITQGTQTGDLSVDGLVYNPSAPVKEVTAGGLLAQETTTDLTASALTQGTSTLATTGDGWIIQVKSLALSADAALQATGQLQSTATALVAGSQTQSLTGDALLSATTLIEASADAKLIGSGFKEVAASAITQQLDQVLTTSATGFVLQTKTLDLGASATAAGTITISVDGSGTVSLSTGKTFEITGDAILYPSLTDQTKQLFTDAWLANTAATTKFVSVSASGRVASSYPELTSDAFVTIPLTALRAVSTSATDLIAPSSYHLAVGERTDGAALINLAYVVPNSFALSADVTAQAIGFAVDLKTRNASESYTIQLLQGTSVIASAAFTANMLTGAALTSSAIGWYVLPLTSNVALSAGTLYSLKIVGTGSLNVLATRNVAGFDGFFGSVFNSFVVTTDVAPSLATRPLSLLTQVGSLGPSATLSSSATLTDLTIGPGASLTLDPTQSLGLTLSSKLLLCGDATLTSAPGSTQNHTISLSSGASATFHGTLALSGQAKTRSTSTNADGLATDTSLALLDTPTGWVSGDQIYVSNAQSGDGQILGLTSLSGATATFATTLGQAVPTGSLVVNLSRSVSIQGVSENDRANVLIGPSCQLALNHVRWRCLGSTQSFPGAQGSGSVSDLVLGENRLFGSPDGISAGQLTSAITASDWTIYRSGSGITFTGDASHGGTILLCDIYQQNSALVIKSPSYRSATLRADVIASGLAGAAVTLGYFGNFIGSIENRWAHGDGALVAVTGAAGRVELTRGLLSTSSNDYAGNSAVLWIWEGGSLGRFRGTSLLADSPWLWIVDGFLGDGEVTGSVSTFTSDTAVQAWANNANGIPPFVRFRDDAGDNFQDYDAINIRAGSVVARRNRQLETDALFERSTTSHSGAYSLKATSQTLDGIFQDQTNFGAQTELDRITLGSGESITLQAYVQGDGALFLGTTVLPVSASVFTAVTISYTATQDEVILFGLSVTGTQVLYLDDVRRL